LKEYNSRCHIGIAISSFSVLSEIEESIDQPVLAMISPKITSSGSALTIKLLLGCLKLPLPISLVSIVYVCICLFVLLYTVCCIC
jgi:hypothetical protein